MGVTSGGEAPQYPFSFLSYHSQAPSVGLEAVGGNTASSSLPRRWRATGLAMCATNSSLLLSPVERQTRSEPGWRDTRVTVTPRQGAEQKQTSTCFLDRSSAPPHHHHHHSSHSCVLVNTEGAGREEEEASGATVGTGHPDGHRTDPRLQGRGGRCESGARGWRQRRRLQRQGCFGLREEEAGSGSCTSLGSAVGDTDTRVESEAIRDGAVGSASVQTWPELRRPLHTDSPKSAPLIPLAP